MTHSKLCQWHKTINTAVLLSGRDYHPCKSQLAIFNTIPLLMCEKYNKRYSYKLNARYFAECHFHYRSQDLTSVANELLVNYFS